MSLKTLKRRIRRSQLMSADASLQGTIEPCAEEDKQWHPEHHLGCFSCMFSRGGVKQRMRTNHGCDPPPFPSRSQRIKYFHMWRFSVWRTKLQTNSAISRSLFSAISLIVWKAISTLSCWLTLPLSWSSCTWVRSCPEGVGQVARPLTQHV